MPLHWAGLTRAAFARGHKESDTVLRETEPREIRSRFPSREGTILYLSLRSKTDFGTVEIAKEHGGFGASELTQTRLGITDSEPFLRMLCIGLSSRVSI
ncbi:hypothetical protein TNCV_4942101 [Trichonephila clavipes]|nr:hypothetical protein TNCV_4942101 [Trichonephila clavipes]